MDVIVAPDRMRRMELTAPARTASSPAVKRRKNVVGRSSSRSHTAACTATSIRLSMRSSANPRARWNAPVPAAAASSATTRCSTWTRSDSGMAVSKMAPVAMGVSSPSTPAARPAASSMSASRPPPWIPNRNTSKAESARFGKGR